MVDMGWFSGPLFWEPPIWMHWKDVSTWVPMSSWGEPAPLHFLEAGANFFAVGSFTYGILWHLGNPRSNCDIRWCWRTASHDQPTISDCENWRSNTLVLCCCYFLKCGRPFKLWPWGTPERTQNWGLLLKWWVSMIVGSYQRHPLR